MHAKYEVAISYGSKVIAKVKVDNRQTNKQTNRQTNKQTDRQDKNNMPPIIRSGGIKGCNLMHGLNFVNIRLFKGWLNECSHTMNCVKICF